MEIIPLLFGTLLALLCLGVGVVYGVFFAKGKKRWGGAALMALGLLGLVPFAMIPGPLSPTMANMSGTYEGDFGIGNNTFVLHSDGTFDQKFTNRPGRIYTSRGTWKLKSNYLLSTIIFDRLLVPSGFPFDAFGTDVSPTNYGGAVHPVENAIYFNDDAGIKIYRTK